VAALCLAFGALLFLAHRKARRHCRMQMPALSVRLPKRTRRTKTPATPIAPRATEREEAQAALRRAQAESGGRRASCSAIGQMSGGHQSTNLNQPL